MIHMNAIRFLVLLLISAPAAFATARIYKDTDASSPDGHYRVTAKSPDNARPGRRVFQRNFDMAMLDTKMQRQVWNFNGGKDLVPERIIVSNSGMTMVYYLRSATFVDLTGKRHQLKLFPSAEDEKYVHNTTAGPMWTGMSRWSFAEINKREYFVIRTWWANRLIADLQTFEAIKPDKGLTQALDAVDQQWVRQTLGDAQANRYERATAAHMAGQLGMMDALPLLYEAERSTDSWSSSSSFVGPWSNAWIHSLGIRAAAQLSIRRLGGHASGLPSTVAHSQQDKSPAPATAPFRYEGQPREHWIGEIKTGMSITEVVKRIGFPDAFCPELPVRNDADAWDWDMDTDKPFTLRVRYRGDSVLSVERFEPPVWKTSLARDEELAN